MKDTKNDMTVPSPATAKVWKNRVNNRQVMTDAILREDGTIVSLVDILTAIGGGSGAVGDIIDNGDGTYTVEKTDGTSFDINTNVSVESVPTSGDLPVPGTDGDLIYVEDEKSLYYYDGSVWKNVSGSGGGTGPVGDYVISITRNSDGNYSINNSDGSVTPLEVSIESVPTSSDLPTDYATGTLHYVEDEGALYYYDGSVWKNVSGSDVGLQEVLDVDSHATIEDFYIRQSGNVHRGFTMTGVYAKVGFGENTGLTVSENQTSLLVDDRGILVSQSSGPKIHRGTEIIGEDSILTKTEIEDAVEGYGYSKSETDTKLDELNLDLSGLETRLSEEEGKTSSVVESGGSFTFTDKYGGNPVTWTAGSSVEYAGEVVNGVVQGVLQDIPTKALFEEVDNEYFTTTTNNVGGSDFSDVVFKNEGLYVATLYAVGSGNNSNSEITGVKWKDDLPFNGDSKVVGDNNFNVAITFIVDVDDVSDVFNFGSFETASGTVEYTSFKMRVQSLGSGTTTDFATKDYVDLQDQALQNQITILDGKFVDYYTKTEIDSTFNNYYDKTEIDNQQSVQDNKITANENSLLLKANATLDNIDVGSSVSGQVLTVNSTGDGAEFKDPAGGTFDPTLYYTKVDIDTKFADYYDKTEIDTRLSEIDDKFNDYYNKAEVDAKFGDYYTKLEMDSQQSIQNDKINANTLSISGIDTRLILEESKSSTVTFDETTSQYIFFDKNGLEIIRWSTEKLLNYIGDFPTVADLPATADVGDVAWVVDDEHLYVWNGSLWYKLDFTVDLSNYYTKSEVDGLFGNYYNKTEIDSSLSAINAKFGDYYLKTEIDTKFNDYYTKAEVDNQFNNYYDKTEIDSQQSAQDDRITANENSLTTKANTTLDNVDSTGANSGDVLSADGAGGVAWQPVATGGAKIFEFTNIGSAFDVDAGGSGVAAVGLKELFTQNPTFGDYAEASGIYLIAKSGYSLELVAEVELFQNNVIPAWDIHVLENRFDGGAYSNGLAGKVLPPPTVEKNNFRYCTTSSTMTTSSGVAVSPIYLGLDVLSTDTKIDPVAKNIIIKVTEVTTVS